MTLSANVGSSDKEMTIIMNAELSRIWGETVVANLNVPPQTEQIKKSSVRTVCLLKDITNAVLQKFWKIILMNFQMEYLPFRTRNWYFDTYLFIRNVIV